MSAGSTALTAPTPTDFDAGFNATTGPTLTVSSNAAWTLHIRSAATFWTATNTSPGAPARTTKPAADLQWSTASNGTFNALTTSDVNLVVCAATASNATTLFFQTLYSWTLDTPGNYSLSVVLTLTSP
jgi:type VI protein secretion system component VasA